jgi:hypothetical protein
LAAATAQHRAALERFTGLHGTPAHRSDLDVDFWYLSASDIPGLLGHMESNRPWGKSRWGTDIVTLSMKHEFLLTNGDSFIPVDPDGETSYGDYCADQRSLLYLGKCVGVIGFARTNQAYVWLTFPFQYEDKALLDLIAAIRRNTCMRISRGKWRRWMLSKNGGSYVGRKVSMPTAQDA